ncbi:MAG: helix-turn-helix transcriptional regulator [Paludibacteraceae bacterium]|nr:helix-turn-helix transcriptional regulator [Paludibacteraceae bacterium]
MNYNEEINHIVTKIKEIRSSQNMSIQDLAYKCDMERSNMSRIEAGHTNITIKTLCKICTALNIPLSTLFDK